MMTAPEGKEFIFKDGSKAQTLKELSISVKLMSDYEFSSFVNDSKNDFANWIEFVLFDAQLASRLRMQKTRDETIKIIDSKISEINSLSERQNNIDNSTNKKTETVTTASRTTNSNVEHVKTSETVEDFAASKLNHHATHEHHMHSQSDNSSNISETKYQTENVSNTKEVSNAEVSNTNKWFDFFKASNPKKDPKPKVSMQYEPEQLLWIGIYALLILVIISLLAYKLFFSN